jgi:hypothetical protein
MGSKVGSNNFQNRKDVRPFTCEIPAVDGEVIVTPASIAATLGTATFVDTGLPIDLAYACLSQVEVVLTDLGDEAEGGFVTTACQAVATDTETGKTKDIEPGGNYELEVGLGSSVPDFSVAVTAGSNVVVCGVWSMCIGKDGEPVMKDV